MYCIHVFKNYVYYITPKLYKCQYKKIWRIVIFAIPVSYTLLFLYNLKFFFSLLICNQANCPTFTTIAYKQLRLPSALIPHISEQKNLLYLPLPHQSVHMLHIVKLKKQFRHQSNRQFPPMDLKQS